MKLFLLAAVALAVLHNCAALECWGVDAQSLKICSNPQGKAVDTSTCAKKQCGKGQMCARSTAQAGGHAAAVLPGCMAATEAKCSSTGAGNAAVEVCTCNTDLCNGATFGTISTTTVFVSFTAFLIAMVR